MHISCCFVSSNWWATTELQSNLDHNNKSTLVKRRPLTNERRTFSAIIETLASDLDSYIWADAILVFSEVAGCGRLLNLIGCSWNILLTANIHSNRWCWIFKTDLTQSVSAQSACWEWLSATTTPRLSLFVKLTESQSFGCSCVAAWIICGRNV